MTYVCVFTVQRTTFFRRQKEKMNDIIVRTTTNITLHINNVFILVLCYAVQKNRIDISAIANTKLSKWLHAIGAKKISNQIVVLASADFSYEVKSIKTKKTGNLNDLARSIRRNHRGKMSYKLNLYAS